VRLPQMREPIYLVLHVSPMMASDELSIGKHKARIGPIERVRRCSRKE